MMGLTLNVSIGGHFAELAAAENTGFVWRSFAGVLDTFTSFRGLGLGLLLAAATLMFSAAVSKLLSQFLEKTRRESPVADFSLLSIDTDEYWDDAVLFDVLMARDTLAADEKRRQGRSFQWVEALPEIDTVEQVRT